MNLNGSNGTKRDVGYRLQIEGCRLPMGSFLPHTLWQLLKQLRRFLRDLFNRQSPQFAKYQPALRLGTRRVEQRLLSRITRAEFETSC